MEERGRGRQLERGAMRRDGESEGTGREIGSEEERKVERVGGRGREGQEEEREIGREKGTDKGERDIKSEGQRGRGA